MDVVGSEIGQKMRSAIKAKLTELGCYVDDELPDYVMVMVANKRTRAQMEDDLQLFLGDNTELFVNWLHQVLKKLQEVTVPPPKQDAEVTKDKPKEKKAKEKKDKDKTKSKKTDSVKKAKKKDKQKEKHRKKEEKKSHKSKKKSKHHDEIIRPNIPPLLMNIEKESEPSITDVFAGQILKNHGVIIDTPKEEKPEEKPIIREVKKPILPIIDPATISSTIDADETPVEQNTTAAAPREEQIKEINEIEAKIQGLKQKLAEQLDSMSEDEDFLNIRTEAEELMNDFAEDVFQEISSQAPAVVATPPIAPNKSPTPPPPKNPEPVEIPKSPEPEPPKEDPKKEPTPPKIPEPEILPQIELNLPKRPIRERLGAKEEAKKKITEEKQKEESTKTHKRIESPERLTPEKEPDFWGRYKSAKSRLGSPPEPVRKSPVTFKRKSVSEESDSSDSSFKRDKKSASERARVRRTCASVVRVKPRPRVAPASSLLLRAVADAHKSLLSIPPKVESEPPKIKRALVLPMRRGDAQNIVIQVPSDRHEKGSSSEREKEEYIPSPLCKKIINTEYVPSLRRPERVDRVERVDRASARRDDSLAIDTLNIHNPTVGKDKKTQFIVTMDGFNPNAFLAKKLKTEGLLDEELDETPKDSKSVLKIPQSAIRTTDEEEIKLTKTDAEARHKIIEKVVSNIDEMDRIPDKVIERPKDFRKREHKDRNIEAEDKENQTNDDKSDSSDPPQKKRLSDTSDDSDINVIIKNPQPISDEKVKTEDEEPIKEKHTVVALASQSKKRKASPIVFDVSKKEKEDKQKEPSKRERSESASSDNHVIVTTAPTHKYDSVPPLSAAEKKATPCRAFPLCRFGAACAFQHPRCKFAAACTRRRCVYAHATPPVVSQVVPAPNFKTITSAPSICMYYPNCTNPACHFYHPKPCRYGKACANKLECNFYHHDMPSKWRYPV